MTARISVADLAVLARIAGGSPDFDLRPSADERELYAYAGYGAAPASRRATRTMMRRLDSLGFTLTYEQNGFYVGSLRATGKAALHAYRSAIGIAPDTL